MRADAGSRSGDPVASNPNSSARHTGGSDGVSLREPPPD